MGRGTGKEDRVVQGFPIIRINQYIGLQSLMLLRAVSSFATINP